MPFKYIVEHWHLPKEYNRRAKLLPKDKEKKSNNFMRPEQA